MSVSFLVASEYGLIFPLPALLQAAINATTLALVSAGLPLSDYVCALSLASYPSIAPLATPQIAPFTLSSPPVPFSNASPTSPAGSGSGSTTLLDLCSAEETALPCLTVAVLPRSGKVTLVSLETRVGIGRFEEMLRWGVEGAVVVQGAMEEVSTSPHDGRVCNNHTDLGSSRLCATGRIRSLHLRNISGRSFQVSWEANLRWIWKSRVVCNAFRHLLPVVCRKG